ncbi:MAG: hypothetical protein KF878_37605 [Planctomycetes bacterium]|nr:hypothetical protein [Planctomycetota bacterium]
MTTRTLAVALALTLAGCIGGIRHSTTARTSTEMLLMSLAAERAVRQWDPRPLAGRRVFIDDTYLDSIDKPYVLSALRGQTARSGVLLVDREEAELVLEVRCGSHALWEGSWLIGPPPLPLAFGGPTVLSPDLSFGLEAEQGWAKLELFVYDAVTKEVVATSGTLWGCSREDPINSVYPSLLDKAKAAVSGEDGPRDDHHLTAEYLLPE